MNKLEFEKARLCDTLWQESHAEQLNGFRAIGFIIKNRVTAGWGTWMQVLQKHWEYHGNASRPTPDLDPGQYLFRELLWLADAIYDNSEKDEITTCLIGDKPVSALWYYRAGEPMADWFKEKIVGDRTNHRVVGMVGSIWMFT